VRIGDSGAAVTGYEPSSPTVVGVNSHSNEEGEVVGSPRSERGKMPEVRITADVMNPNLRTKGKELSHAVSFAVVLCPARRIVRRPG
jgi:hypothetical protein